MTTTFFSYWGKARSADEAGERYHLLPFHCLDVAACGRELLRLPQFSLDCLANDVGWPRDRIEALFTFFLALHDLGKFSRSFQGLAPNLSDALVPAHGGLHGPRHDTLGWLLWSRILAPALTDTDLPDPQSGFWAVWIKAVVGHHGHPPKETPDGGTLPFDADRYFLPDDSAAATAFCRELQALLMPSDLVRPSRERTAALKCHAWRLAGLAVLADWLGSNQAFFPYRTEPMALDAYWQEYALPQAQQALEVSGLRAQPLREWPRPAELFDYIAELTPLQRYAAEVPLLPGPQLFLLEDVTGAGKTEAALILAQRLMQCGQATGLYFALPSMATANQMYQRVGRVYRLLYSEDACPSLILAHGARQLVDGFRDSILHPGEQRSDQNYSSDEASATAQCNAWLADSRKKALLAEVGVGTLDQALLAVLPARHQSLRLLGLARKVLLIDEVHAYDRYMMTLLTALLTAHARQGGSVIVLSATLPLATRDQLLRAWRHGLGHDDDQVLDDRRYPLTVQAGAALCVEACPTRPQLRRRVSVRQLHSEDEALAVVLAQARAGRCVCWIRNTVEDARRAWKALKEHLPAGDVDLFHSRFAMGDRLTIEDRVLARFGKHSTADQRRGKVLIGTQVLEQSLDFCVDAMISDLAPMDLLIQRIGRLQRHARTIYGDPAADGIEQREPPVLYVLGPEPVDDPPANWYS
ncbi:MAG: CRISPR-associated helicase Cas3', partial [Burkholderiaceae bacterium]